MHVLIDFAIHTNYEVVPIEFLLHAIVVRGTSDDKETFYFTSPLCTLLLGPRKVGTMVCDIP